VESIIWLPGDILGTLWFAELKYEMYALDTIAKGLYGKVMGYFKAQNMDGAKLASQATHFFWQLCERQFQTLVDLCGADEASTEKRQRLRQTFAGFAQETYNRYCPRETARQMDAWAKCRPHHGQYLQMEA
jgi:CRISPR system Cascade subunit CasA